MVLRATPSYPQARVMAREEAIATTNHHEPHDGVGQEEGA